MRLSWLSLGLQALVAATEFVNTVREYNLTLGTKWSAEDGNGRPTYTINGQTPGPLIWGYEGDTLRITVINALIAEATMHWYGRPLPSRTILMGGRHGVYQIDRYWMDGVPGVTQWPIEARGSYTYEFTLGNQTGSYWYHGHFNAILADGQRGPMWIRPKPLRPRPYSMISEKQEDIAAMLSAEDQAHHLMIYDWNHDTVDQNLVMYRDAGATPSCSASILINGHGRTLCLDKDTIKNSPKGEQRNSLGCLPPDTGAEFMNQRECKPTYTDLAVVQIADGEKYAFMNFIHTGSHHEFRVSIDEHEIWVVAADGDFVQPNKVNAININMAERISIVVPLNQRPKDYTIRITSMSEEQLIYGLGILRYPGVVEKRHSDGTIVIPDTKPVTDLQGNLIEPGVLMDEMKLAPFPARSPPKKADHTYKFTINRPAPDTWTIASEAHQGFRQQLPPMLWNKEYRGETSVDGIKNGSVVDLIFENRKFAMHPFHKHNHKFFIIGMGKGGFHWPDVKTAAKEVPENFNFIDPPLRDGARLEEGEGSWTAIRYEVAFPAMSMLHCHRIHHFAGGQQIILIEGGEAMQDPPEYIRNMTHADFVPPVRYGPLD
ncbi:Multicopper oxidase-like protein 7 [Elsinoe fawcettii]|nr:Multicopper oxidase-like protein 7 [Elsinoe fawcettii]